jgi:hypothetical protein
MLDALGIARDLGAHDAESVAIVPGAFDPANPATAQHRYFERAGAGAIVRASRFRDARMELLHAPFFALPGAASIRIEARLPN